MKIEIKRALVDILNENRDINAIFSDGIKLEDIASYSYPAVIMCDDLENEKEKRRLLYSATEANIILTILFKTNDVESGNLGADLKESIKDSIKNDPQLKGAATYCTMVRSEPNTLIEEGLYSKRMTLYVNFSN